MGLHTGWKKDNGLEKETRRGRGTLKTRHRMQWIGLNVRMCKWAIAMQAIMFTQTANYTTGREPQDGFRGHQKQKTLTEGHVRWSGAVWVCLAVALFEGVTSLTDTFPLSTQSPWEQSQVSTASSESKQTDILGTQWWQGWRSTRTRGQRSPSSL